VYLWLLRLELLDLSGVALHALEDEVDHLRKRGLGSGAVDHVARREVDVVARAHGQQQALPVHFARYGAHGSQQALDDLRRGRAG
jgi:hypothetical protein